ncbi:MAG: DNA repair protein RadC [Lachnospiraceae bacterium]|nr:DNA repair protein RadC [Lachnospiraceae bacterium]
MMNNATKVKDLPLMERPYEKCIKYGVEVLSDAELMAVVIRNGTKTKNSVELCRELINSLEPEKSIRGLENASLEELTKIEGIGTVKAVQLSCLVEFSKRLWRSRYTEKMVYNHPRDIAMYYMEELRNLPAEEVHIMMMDTRCHMLGEFTLSKGAVNSSVVCTREIFTTALKKNAVGIAMVHNHPSGVPTPSAADINLTRKVLEAGSLIEIRLMDSIIIGDGIYTSLREKGLVSFE